MSEWILPHVREEIAQLNKISEGKQIKQEIEQAFRADKGVNYVILDAASWGTYIDTAFELCPQYRCLFATRGAEHNLDDVAPYLFYYFKNTDFANWLERKEKKGFRALYLYSDSSIEILRKHLRRFLRVKTEDGKWLFFRFYDPNVAAYMFRCFTEAQSTAFFSGLRYIAYVQKYESELQVISHHLRENGDLVKSINPTLVFNKAQFAEIKIEKQNIAEKRLRHRLLQSEDYSLMDNETELNQFVHLNTNRAIELGIDNERYIFQYLLLAISHPLLQEDDLPNKLKESLLDKYGSEKIFNTIQSFIEKMEQ